MKNVAADATFEDFVKKHIGKTHLFGADPHVLPQVYSLAPAPYTHAIQMGNLYPEMIKLVGANFAEEYFRAPRNSTSLHESYDEDGLAYVKASDLHNRYVNDKALPMPSALLIPELGECLRSIYLIDYNMINRIEG